MDPGRVSIPEVVPNFQQENKRNRGGTFSCQGKRGNSNKHAHTERAFRSSQFQKQKTKRFERRRTAQETEAGSGGHHAGGKMSSPHLQN
eukprot:scaffold92924_cov49-Attheya_sp.AAC.1